MRLVRAELLKLGTTRLLMWLALLILALAVLVISLNASQQSISDLERAGNQHALVTVAAVSALIAMILGIVSSAGEYAHGTISHTFLVTPLRERVVGAKLVAAAVAGLGLAAFASAVSWGLAALWVAGRSVSVQLWSSDSLELFAGVLVAAAIAGAIGVGFGALVRRQTAAIVVALVWLLIVEPLLGAAGVQQYGPAHAIAAVVNAGHRSSETLRFWPGLALALAYAGVIGLLGTLAVKGSDVS
ncbi:MAG: hypothetical protein ACXVRE_08220 [Gaiellaceae bacterium]